jgi:hypothetical protein
MSFVFYILSHLSQWSTKKTNTYPVAEHVSTGGTVYPSRAYYMCAYYMDMWDYWDKHMITKDLFCPSIGTYWDTLGQAFIISSLQIWNCILNSVQLQLCCM